MLDVFSGICLFVCLFVNTITSGRVITRWWNLGGGGRCTVQKSRPSLNLVVIAPRLGVHPQNCGVRLRRWENQRRLSSFEIILKLFQCPISRVTANGNFPNISKSFQPPKEFWNYFEIISVATLNLLENVRELQWASEMILKQFQAIVSTRWHKTISEGVDEGWNNFEISLFHICNDSSRSTTRVSALKKILLNQPSPAYLRVGASGDGPKTSFGA